MKYKISYAKSEIVAWVFLLAIYFLLSRSDSDLSWRTPEPSERYGVYGYESRWQPLVETFDLSEDDKLAVRELFLDYEGYNSAISDLYHARHISGLEYSEQTMSMEEFLNDYLSAYLASIQLELVAVYEQAYESELRRRLDEEPPDTWSENIFPEICGELGICPQP